MIDCYAHYLYAARATITSIVTPSHSTVVFCFVLPAASTATAISCAAAYGRQNCALVMNTSSRRDDGTRRLKWDCLYALQYNRSQEFRDNHSDPSISCLTRGEGICLALIAEASFISFISIIVIFIWIGWNVRWYRKIFPKDGWRLFQRPADIYVFSLFIFDILQAIRKVACTSMMRASSGFTYRTPIRGFNTQRRAALGMFLHPLAYSVIVVPLSIPRF
ncbi:hypothetical protein V8E52_011203 [Russula decolorans]